MIKGGEKMKKINECEIILPTNHPNDDEVKEAVKKKAGNVEIISWAINDQGKKQQDDKSTILVKYKKPKMIIMNKDSFNLFGCLVYGAVYVVVVITAVIASVIFMFTVKLWWLKILMIVLFASSIILGIFVFPIIIFFWVIPDENKEEKE